MTSAIAATNLRYDWCRKRATEMVCDVKTQNGVSDMKSRDFLIWHLFGRHEIAANLIVAHLSLGGFQNSM